MSKKSIKKFALLFPIVLSFWIIGAAITQDDSSSKDLNEGPARNISHFPINPEDYVPIPIPEPRESAVTQPEMRLATYDLASGVEIVRDSPGIIKGDKKSGQVIGGKLEDEVYTDNLGLLYKLVQQSEEDQFRIANFNDLSLISNPEDYPWRVNCKIYMTFASGYYVGSGILIDSMHVLTAGHCVHDVINGGTWATSIVVVPAYDNGSRPYGDANAVQLHSWTGWTVDANFDHDIGVIDLDRPIGALTGWHGYGWNDNPSFYTGTTFNNAGYPAESPYNGQDMYYWYGTFDFTEYLLGAWYGEEVGINRRAYGGQSGSGAYVIDGSNRIVYAVVSNTVKVSGGPTKFPRITSSKFGHIRDNFIADDTPSTFDLIPLDVQVTPSNPHAGNALATMNYLVHNYSSASWSGTVTVDYYISTNNIISTADHKLKTEYFSYSFGPKSSVRVNSGSPPIIPDCYNGNYWIGIILNISDYSSGNNDSTGQDACPVTVICDKPGSFSYYSPSNSSTGVSLSAYLDWGPSVGVASYDVYFGTTASPPYLANVSSSYYNLPTLSPGTTYYWKIVAKNCCGTTSGPIWSFTTICPVPTAPTNPSPADNATNIPEDTNLDWDDCSGATSYDVYFGTISPPPMVTNVATSSYDPGTLTCGNTYYWKIVAKNSCGNVSGAEWDFATVSCITVKRITETGASSMHPVQARSGNYVYLAWNEGSDLFFIRNTNNGDIGAWDAAQKLNSDGELDSGDNPVDIAAFGSNVYVVAALRSSPGEDYEIWYTRSTNNGASWESLTRMTYNIGESRMPTIASEGAAVYIAWQDNNIGNYEIIFKRSTDNGVNFSAPFRISYSLGESQYPCLAAGGGRVHLVWQDNNPGNYEVYHKSNSNWGTDATWSALWRATYNTGYSWYPRVICDPSGQYVQLVWSDNNPGNYEIYHKRNTNYGAIAAWSGVTRLTYTTGNSSYPDVDVNSAYVDISWSDNNPGNFEIFKKRSVNTGSSFGAAVRLTNNAGASERAKINSYLDKIVWDDNNPGNREIFYK